jgi:CBS domain-containing protein
MVLDVPAGKIARPIVTIDENKSVFDAAKMMADTNRGSVVVTRGGKGIGIITERDILRRVVVKSLNPASTKVKDAMTSPPTTIGHDRPLREAIDLMNRKELRRMLVTDKGEIVGVFTLRDIVKQTRICAYCGKEIRSILEGEAPDPYIECSCGSRYHKDCSKTVGNCVNCGTTLVTNVINPEPSETFSG